MVFHHHCQKPYEFLWLLSMMIEDPMNSYGFLRSQHIFFLPYVLCPTPRHGMRKAARGGRTSWGLCRAPKMRSWREPPDLSQARLRGTMRPGKKKRLELRRSLRAVFCVPEHPEKAAKAMSRVTHFFLTGSRGASTLSNCACISTSGAQSGAPGRSAKRLRKAAK